MGRQYFDDGSFIDTGDDGSTVAWNTSGVAVSKVETDGDYFQSPGYWQDARETQKLDAYTPRPAGDDRPWYERVASYGLTRAIDANFGPPAANKTAAGATFAGQNGKTYSQTGSQSSGGGDGGILPLLLMAGAAFLILG